MIFRPTQLLVLSASVLGMAWPSGNLVGAQPPEPFYKIDFADSSSVAEKVFENNAEILTGPGGVDALRIDNCGKYAILPIDINPSVMPQVTMVLGINLVSIAEGSLGWPLSTDDGGYDRSITLHDSRFLGMGMASGDDLPVWESEDQGKAPLNEWMQVVAVFSQTGRSATSDTGTFYVNAKAAPKTIEVYNGEGRPDIVVGTNLFADCGHWTDSWIKEVQIFDTALSSDQVEALYQDFMEGFGGASGSTGDDSGDDSGVLDNILGSISGSGSSITGGNDESESSDSEDSNFFEDILDSISGSSSTHTLVVAKGMTMILLVGILFGL